MTLIDAEAAAPTADVGGMRLLVIYNPTAGRRGRRVLDTVLAALARHGARVTLQPTARRGDAERMARDASPRDFDRVIVAGGDGTINEAINGLADPRLPVAVIPLGTANVLAAELGLRAHPAAMAQAIVAGPVRPIVLGSVNGRYFTMMAGIGFDAHVVARISPSLKRWTGKLAYVAETLAQLGRYRPTVYDVRIDGRSHRAASAVIAKGHFYGGRFVCAPKARLDAAEFQVCLFGRAGRLHVVRYALALMFGRLDRLPDVTIVPGRRVEVAEPAGEPVHADGDTLARLPVVIELTADRVRLVYPADAVSGAP